MPNLKFYKVRDQIVGEPDVLEPAECGWLDGYRFGDRLLEGVMFRIGFDADGKLTASVGEDSKAYFARLNAKKWLKEAVKTAIVTDVFSTSATANDDAAVLYDHSKSHSEQIAHFEKEPVFLPRAEHSQTK